MPKFKIFRNSVYEVKGFLRFLPYKGMVAIYRSKKCQRRKLKNNGIHLHGPVAGQTSPWDQNKHLPLFPI